MNIAYYCQHIWGVGHLFRSMEICSALSPHRVHLVLGGPAVSIHVPDNVEIFRLPAIMTDRHYRGLYTDVEGRSLAEVQEQRRKMLFDFIAALRPDALVVELFPFGRRAFRFELDPLLDAIRDGDLPGCPVFCSLRDILVEKKDAAAYEAWVVDRLNRQFDALFIHADQKLVRLEETFGRTGDIMIPTVYTGYVARREIIPPDERRRFREALGVAEHEKMVLASAGGARPARTCWSPWWRRFR